MSENFLFLLEIIGTVAFAASGAMVGLSKKMDIFGVTVLGIVTSVGGGIIRDIILQGAEMEDKEVSIPYSKSKKVFACITCV